MNGQEVKIVKAVIVNAISSKTNNPYSALDVYITPTTKKRVFMSDAELELLKNTQSNIQSK